METRLVNVATCNLNQWAMDFEGNIARIKESITVARSKGCKLRLGPELEVTGYCCEDHFLEEDTFAHAWECVVDLVESGFTDGIIVDLGMPVRHRGVAYNCRVFLLDRRILLIRPKMNLADDGNYRECRWFTGWSRGFTLQEYILPSVAGLQAALQGQVKVPFGVAAVATRDAVIASESCEELFVPNSPHIALGLDGVDIILNGSGSHHQLRKLHTRYDLMKNASSKGGGTYVYANQQGCDGTRLYFDGSAMIFNNGELLVQASQFAVRDVEVVAATVDLADIAAYRGSIASRNVQGASATSIPRVEADIALACGSAACASASLPIKPTFLTAEEEIAHGPPCWLWDYLRRSGQKGYFVPLSGGADSASTATLTALMCQYVVDYINTPEGERTEELSRDIAGTLADVRRIVGKPDFFPRTREELCSKVLYTCYMGTQYSSEETRSRAASLSEVLGASHRAIKIDGVTESLTQVFMQASVSNRVPDIRNTNTAENIAQQNIQARSRMVIAYQMAQLIKWDEGSSGSLLVLGSSNVDEALRGYYTKYDCSAADINPIGGISKVDLRRFLTWCADTKGWAPHRDVVEATPTAELQPLSDKGEVTQSDEVEMGMSYDELSIFGALRSYKRCGPVSMFTKLLHSWGRSGQGVETPHSPTTGHVVQRYTLVEIAEKVKRFFRFYAINRHKMTTLTPSYHAENYSPDDNRFDLRPFLYRVSWPFQFAKIDSLVQQLEPYWTSAAGTKE